MIARRTLMRLALGGGAALLAGCGPRAAERRSDVIRLWVAPNAAEEAFWKVAVARWNALGRGLPVTFTTIPTAGSSEDTVLSALVAGTEPDLATTVEPAVRDHQTFYPFGNGGLAADAELHGVAAHAVAYRQAITIDGLAVIVEWRGDAARSLANVRAVIVRSGMVALPALTETRWYTPSSRPLASSRPSG